MATGFKIASGADLDTLFMARTSAAAANVDFKDPGGTDLSQYFEPRGATTAIANTNFKNSAGTDLAQIFKDIAATPALVTTTMKAGAGAADNGWRNTASGYSQYGTATMTGTPEWTKSSTLYRLDELSSQNSGGVCSLMIRVSQASVTPADADTVFQLINISGVFASGAGSGTKTFVRSTRSASVTGTTPNSRPSRNWQFSWTSTDAARIEFVSGNNYTVSIS